MITSKQIKIVYCIPELFHPGGMERIILMKASFLAEFNNSQNYKVTIITTGQQSKPIYYDHSEKIEFIDLGINHNEIIHYPFLKRYISRRKKRKEHKMKLTRVLKKISADIVISTFTHEAAFLPSIKDGSKKILEFHFSKGFRLQQAKTHRYSFLLKMANMYLSYKEEHIIPLKYDAFVVLTNEDKADWKKIIPNVIAIPNIIPYSTMTSEKKNKIALSIGRLDYQKGFDRLINIWKLICKQNEGWTLNIFGSGEDFDDLNNQIKSNNLQDQIHIFPPEQDICKRYVESSIFLTTSRYEGFPMVLLEAMNSGLPCISYSYKCGPSDAIKNNINGFLIEDGNEQLFADKLILLMEDKELRIKLGNNAQKEAQKYTLDNVMQHWINLFHKIL